MNTVRFTLIGALLFVSMTAAATTHVVAPDGSGDHPTIQAALDAALDGDTIVLLDGTFAGPGNRDLIVANRTLTIGSQSGDPELAVIACEGTATDPHRFLTIQGSSGTVEVAGLGITGGHAGGRIPGGGGMLILDGSSAQIRSCRFFDNHAAMSWDNAGGAVYVDDGCDPTFTDCEFRENSGYFGGAVGVNHFSHATFEGCFFVDNSGGRGGAIWGNSTTKIGCVLVGNTAEQGGAIWGNGFNAEESIGCTYALNGAPAGGAIYAANGYGSPVVLQNTVLVFSTDGTGVLAGDGVPLEIACSDIFGNLDGDWVGELAGFADVDGNFAANPCFCDLDGYELGVCGDSVCLPAYSPGGCLELVGALGAGCPDCDCAGVVATESRSWSAIRSMFWR